MAYNTYDAEQQDRIRRVGKEMRAAAPITNRTVSAPGESKMCKQIKGGPTGSGKSRKAGY
jgi:hypothetical protein